MGRLSLGAVRMARACGVSTDSSTANSRHRCFGRLVVVGDDAGLVHLLSRTDGSPLNRLATDGSAIAAAPVVAADTLVVVTRNGGIYGFRPD